MSGHVAAGGERRIALVITWAAAIIAAVVSLAGPASYAWLSWRAQQQDTHITARLHATFATQALVQSGEDWRRDVEGLVDEALVAQPLPERRAIVDAQGQVVTRSGGKASWPEVQAQAPLHRAGELVGHVLIARSLRPVLAETLMVGALSAALGLAIYLTLRVLPLRALHRALEVLAGEQDRARQALEQYVDVLFQRSIDGIVVFDQGGLVRSCNPRAAAMFGVPSNEVVGRPLHLWVDPPLANDAGALAKEGTIETRAVRSEGEVTKPFPCEFTVSVLPVPGHEDGFVGMLRDLTERRHAEERQRRLANYDSLTGLPNRSLFRDRLEQAMSRARRSGTQVALMFLDLDRFKTINDSLGHDAGDRLLRHVAHTLMQALRECDSVAPAAVTRPIGDEGFVVSRLGGDEFTVIAEALADSESAAAIAQRIQRALERPFDLGGEEVIVTTSIGITMYPADNSPLDDLLKHADMAMYRAKELGRNGFQFYSEAMNADLARRLQLENRLRHALERGEFVLHFQPKAGLVDGALTGAEALLRWQPDGEALVAPEAFVPLLEETGLIVPVGEWVIGEALRQIAVWRSLGLPALRVAVNVSGRQLRNGDLVEVVRRQLAAHAVPAALLELELTESVLMDNDLHARTMQELAGLGVGLAIDDFGTGYSSLSYLKRFCVDTLKIDRSFVRDTPTDPEDNAITRAIIAMGKSLNLRVVAEGVESRAQADFLAASGCDEMQGWLLGRAMPPERFLAWRRDQPGAGACGRDDR